MIRILLVDDEPAICAGLRAKLESLPLDKIGVIRSAQSVQEALRLFSRERFDILFTDINMPGESGLDLLRELRRRNIGVKAIVLSGYDDYPYVRESFQLGVFDYLLKPVSTGELREKLEALLALPDSRAPGEEEPGCRSVSELARAYVEAHYAENISMTVIANLVSMNYTYFSELFRLETGIGFRDFVMQVRVREAKRLLADPTIRVNDVAALVGYENPKNFSRAFHKLTGSTPTDYRKAHGAGEPRGESG